MSSPTLICCAYPFGYGPAAKLLLISRRLRAAGIRTVFLGHGIAHELASGGEEFDQVIHTLPADPVAARIIAQADGVFSMMDRDFARLAVAQARPLYVADSLLWMRDQLPEPFDRAERYWAQNFGLAPRPGMGEPTVVGPIVEPALPSPGHSRRGWVVNLGGCESPFDSASEDWPYPDWIMRGLLRSRAVERFDGPVTLLAGHRTVAGLKARFPVGKIRVESLSHDDALAALASAERVLTSPGLTTCLECFQLTVPTFFLPPQNYSQWRVLDHLRTLGLADGCFAWSQAAREPVDLASLPEAQRTPRVRRIFAECAGIESASAMFVQAMDRWLAADQRDLARRQRTFFDSLGPNGAERIASCLMERLRPPVAISVGLQQPSRIE